MNTQIKQLLLFVAATLLVVLATSCSTVRGFGQDVEKVGDKIQHSSH